MVPVNSVDRSLAQQLEQLALLTDSVSAEPSPDRGFSAYIAEHEHPGSGLQLMLRLLATPDIGRFREAPYFAFSGYGLSLGALQPDAADSWRKSFADLKRKDPFPVDRQSLFFRPLEVLGVALGAARAFQATDAEHAWLIVQVRAAAQHVSDQDHWAELIMQMSAHALGATWRDTSFELDRMEFASIGLWYWLHVRHPVVLRGRRMELSALGTKLLERIVSQRVDDSSIGQASVLLASLRVIISQSVSSFFKPIQYVSAVLSGVGSGLRRWRYDPEEKTDGTRWPIRNEKHVQDFLWLVLRPVFPDLIDEEALPTFGFKQATPDFAIPSLDLLLELKFVYARDDFKKRFEEIVKDVGEYFTAAPQFKHLIAVVYDDVPCSELHEQFKNELRRLPQIRDVVIIERPSKVPAVRSGAQSVPISKTT